MQRGQHVEGHSRQQTDLAPASWCGVGFLGLVGLGGWVVWVVWIVWVVWVGWLHHLVAVSVLLVGGLAGLDWVSAALDSVWFIGLVWFWLGCFGFLGCIGAWLGLD